MPLRPFPSLSLASLTITVGLLILTGCSDRNTEVQAPPPSVSVIEVGAQDVGRRTEYVARTEAFRTVELRARVEGTITQRLFREGDTVTEGQLLFEIDRENYLAAYEQAKANLSSAQVEQQLTERDYKRGQELRPNGFISQADLDTLGSNAAKAKAAEKAAEAALQNASVNLSYTRIKAPFTGRISTVSYNIGNLVGPGSNPLATLLQDDPIYASFQMDESSYTTYLQASSQETGGEPVPPAEGSLVISLVLPNGTVHDHPGRFNYAGISINSTTGTVNLRAEFANPKGIVRPGLYATLVIESTATSRQPVVPQYAVQEGQQGKFVLIVDSDNKVQARNIHVGRTLGALWAVTDGLQAGDRIVVEGLQKVRTGIQVNPQLKYLNTKTGTLLSNPAGATEPSTTSADNQPAS